MSDDKVHEAARASKRLLGGLLMAVGGMIALLCGLCTLGFGYLMVAQPGDGGLTLLIIPLIVGGTPTGLGVVVFLIGRSIYREGRARRGEPWREFE